MDYEALAEQIESILQDPDAKIKDDLTRRRLAHGARKLSIALEQPMETLRRFGYTVNRTADLIYLSS